MAWLNVARGAGGASRDDNALGVEIKLDRLALGRLERGV
jgi:hypothetical protein